MRGEDTARHGVSGIGNLEYAEPAGHPLCPYVDNPMTRPHVYFSKSALPTRLHDARARTGEEDALSAFSHFAYAELGDGDNR